jgi:hypothetical protein
MLHHVAFVRTDVSKERIASTIRVRRIGNLGTTLAVISNRSTLRGNTSLVTLMMEAIRSSETSVLTSATQHNVPEHGILQEDRCLLVRFAMQSGRNVRAFTA